MTKSEIIEKVRVFLQFALPIGFVLSLFIGWIITAGIINVLIAIGCLVLLVGVAAFLSWVYHGSSIGYSDYDDY